jgi:hypothetical protein
MSTIGPRSRSRSVRTAGLVIALLGLAVLLAGPAEVGAALFFPGVVLAIAADSRIPRAARPDGYRHGPSSAHHWFFDGSGGDFGGGGGDGGGC